MIVLIENGDGCQATLPTPPPSPGRTYCLLECPSTIFNFNHHSSFPYIAYRRCKVHLPLDNNCRIPVLIVRLVQVTIRLSNHNIGVDFEIDCTADRLLGH